MQESTENSFKIVWLNHVSQSEYLGRRVWVCIENTEDKNMEQTQLFDIYHYGNAANYKKGSIVTMLKKDGVYIKIEMQEPR